MSKYMWVLVISGIVPVLFSFYPTLYFWRKWKALFGTIGIILFSFGIWDVWATFRGHWWFHPRYAGTFYIINLPLEEVLFFVIIPFCCIFTWEVINYFWKE